MKYTFKCGCEFETEGADNKKSDGLPHIRFNPSIEDVNENCQATWDLLKRGTTKGVFQLEGGLGSSWAKKLKPTSIEDLAVLLSLIRPGCIKVKVDGKNMAQHYVDRKFGKEKVEHIHPCLESILGPTQGVLIFQEQSLAISQLVAGFNLKEADSLRKCIAQGSYMYLQNGPKKIEDITIDGNNKPSILTTDDNGKLIYKKISKVWNSGKQDVFEISTSTGYKIKVTSKHKIYTQRGWVKTEDLIPKEDFAIIPNIYNYKGFTRNINKDDAILLSYIVSEGYHSKKMTTIVNKDKWVIDIVTKILDDKFDNGYNIYT